MGNSQSANNIPQARLLVTHPRSSKSSRIGVRHASSISLFVDTLQDTSEFDHEKHNYDSQSLAYVPDSPSIQNDSTDAYRAFLKIYPEYRRTWILDTLRRTDFARLDRAGETYVDYMGGSLYPESLIRAHTAFLCKNILGNTHSVSNR